MHSYRTLNRRKHDAASGPLTIQCSTQRWSQVFKLPVCPPLLHYACGRVECGKIGLEGDVAWRHGQPSTQALKGTPPTVVPAGQESTALFHTALQDQGTLCGVHKTYKDGMHIVHTGGVLFFVMSDTCAFASCCCKSPCPR